MKTTEQQFEPILLNIDKFRVQTRKTDLDRELNFYNDVLRIARSILGEITDSTAVEILSALNRKEAVMKKLRKTYQFPNATDEFNLSALGIDVSVMDHSFNNRMFVSKYFEVKNGKVALSPEIDEILTDEFSTYTRHEVQNNEYHRINKFCEMLNGFKDSSMIDSSYGHVLAPFRFADYDPEKGYIPKSSYVKDIDENGIYRGL
ncbi:hypothetical protein BST97_12090 [Nonlabens spongiae]|uniref:Uncharacterized protein n=1 Tax=Nonlabens spongiae TaxID=331648 RepID=A0A1W6MM37_9FLAO|nr:hypothetical protein [Nonlabens spongiae]ARN78670.1 hypothetical protein BST97_12090 [Nonlabens spongiae]